MDARVRAALADFGAFFALHEDADEQAEHVKALCAQHGIKIQEFFAGAYLVFVGRERGPKLLPLLNALEREFAAARLKNEG
jgi:lysyl-tRNA synthetase class I